MPTAILFALLAALVTILWGLALMRWVIKLPSGTDRMREIAAAIQAGAKAYLTRQYKTVGVIALVLFILLGLFWNWLTASAFLVGAVLSAAAGFIGMNISVRANVRTAEAAKESLAQAFKVAVRGGSVTGLLVVGLALFGVAGFYWLSGGNLPALIGLGFGGSLISVFARLGGGIYTKAADVGADLVGEI